MRAGFKLHGEYLGPRPRRFSPSGFFFTGDVSLRTGPPPPIEWLPFQPLVVAVLITPKGAESPGSDRIGVIRVLVFFLSHAVGAEGFRTRVPRM